MSYVISEDGSVRHENPADPLQRLKDGMAVLARQLVAEQAHRKRLQAAIRAFLGSGDRQSLVTEIDLGDGTETQEPKPR